MSGRWTRRDVLRAGLVGAGALVVPGRAVATSAGAELRAAMHETLHLARTPSVSVAAVYGGQVVWRHAVGLADVERSIDADVGTLYGLASVSKTVIAVAVMQAVEDGLLELDAAVEEVLPFAVRNPRFPLVPITVRQLLTHTSSIKDNWTWLIGLTVEGDSPIPLMRFLRGYLVPGGRWYDRNQNFTERAPGTRYLYGNVGACVAAAAVEGAAGIGFDTWCDERIFAPLGMTRTGWHLADVPVQDVATPYAYVAGQDTWSSFGQYGYPDYPDGQLRSTPTDMARFLAAVARGGAPILTSASVREMLRGQLDAIGVAGQGLIWYQDGSAIGHNGGYDGMAAEMFFRPSDGSGAMVAANVSAWATSRWAAIVALRNHVLDLAPRL